MSDVPKVAINGFGRIGRLATRALVEGLPEVDIVAINDIGDPVHLAHLFTFDSNHGKYPGNVEVDGGDLVIAEDRIRILSEKDPSRLPWAELEVDYVLECTGKFDTRADLQKHLDAGAKRVILSAPGKGVDVTLVLGVNEHAYDPARHRIVSNASCTTNCLAPLLKVLHEAFGVKQAFMTTVHSYTNDQRLLDSQHDDLRRARSAALSLVPTTTGAARAIGDVLPALAGKVDGIAIRVPTPNVSLLDLTARLSQDVDVERVAAAFRARESGFLRTESKTLVSVDFNHDPCSAIVDLPSLMVVDRSLVKVLAWYDNEYAYANRTAELVYYMWKAET